MSTTSQTTYYDLVIVAESSDTEIWLGDEQGHFVQKEIGTLSTGLLPGTYVVEFGLGTPQYEVALIANSSYAEAELKADGPCVRRIPRFSE